MVIGQQPVIPSEVHALLITRLIGPVWMHLRASSVDLDTACVVRSSVDDSLIILCRHTPLPVRYPIHIQCVRYREGCLYTALPPCKIPHTYTVCTLQGGLTSYLEPALVGVSFRCRQESRADPHAWCHTGDK